MEVWYGASEKVAYCKISAGTSFSYTVTLPADLSAYPKAFTSYNFAQVFDTSITSANQVPASTPSYLYNNVFDDSADSVGWTPTVWYVTEGLGGNVLGPDPYLLH